MRPSITHKCCGINLKIGVIILALHAVASGIWCIFLGTNAHFVLLLVEGGECTIFFEFDSTIIEI